MKQITEWFKAIGIVLGLVAMLYATWLVAIITAIVAVIFLVKLTLEDP